MQTNKSRETQTLVAVALGKQKAQTVIQNCNLINVNTKEIIENVDIAIVGGRIALVGDATHTIGESTQVIDATGLYASPGFMDGHIHVESSMMSVSEYAKIVIPHGTSAIFPDPHEIANVIGIKGVEFMMADAKNVPLRVFTTMPSCVPAVEDFETNGATIDAKDIQEFMKRDDIFGLGEMMNYPGVLCGEKQVHEKLCATINNNKIVTGHFPVNVSKSGDELNAYIAAGARCCHESVRKQDALAKMRLGMYAQIREGSAWRDLEEVIKSVTEQNIDTRFAMLVSDDTHPNTLVELGHMDNIVARAIQEGVDPINAIQMVTINVAQCFKIDEDFGSISPGKFADILLISDLKKVKVQSVLINGECVAKNGKLIPEIPKVKYPEFVYNTVRLPKELLKEDFVVKVPKKYKGAKQVVSKIIQIIPSKVGTIQKKEALQVCDDSVCIDIKRDIIKAAVIERHKNTGEIGLGFVNGFRLNAGAVASTVSHDAHNIIVVGANETDMALAANTLASVGGGMIAVLDGEILALLALPIAGIMSEESASEISKKVAKLDVAWKKLGCDMVSPFMTMALIALAVLPELRLTNKGLVDTLQYKLTELFD